MTLACIRNLGAHDQQVVTLQGWLCGHRTGGKIQFLQVRDGTGVCQCIVEAAQAEAFAAAAHLPRESSLRVTGVVRRDTRSSGGYELAVTDLTVIQTAGEFPIGAKAHGIDFLLQHRHLWLRSSRPTAIMRIRHTLIQACRRFFDDQGFTLVDTPIISAGAGEDTQTLFSVDYFGDEAYLAQTGQLYLESACLALGKVYCFGPTFRAEKSKTRRHLTEFWMVEPEVAFADLETVMTLAEDMLRTCVDAVLDANQAELELLGRDVAALATIGEPFVRLTYSEAVEQLRGPATRAHVAQREETARETLAASQKELRNLESQLAASKKAWKQDALAAKMAALREQMGGLERALAHLPQHLSLAQDFQWGKDLGGSDETLLSEQYDRPIFVTHYPAEAKAFYMKADPADSRVVLNMDLLAPEGYGEIIGGSQREDDLSALEAAMRRKQLDPEDYTWYRDLRRYGSVPHGGFGMGIERALTWICGLKHVRETIAFPRTMGRLHP